MNKEKKAFPEFRSGRHVGRTHALMQKIKDDPNMILIVATKNQYDQIMAAYNPKCKVMINLDPDKLRGLHPNRIVKDPFVEELEALKELRSEGYQRLFNREYIGEWIYDTEEDKCK